MIVPICMLVAAALAGNAAGDLPPLERSYNILILIPNSSRSHRVVLVAAAESLAQRGHQVVMLTNSAKAVTTHPNITEVFHGLLHRKETGHDMFKSRKKIFGFHRLISEGLRKTARDLYHVAAVKDLYRRRKEFDLIVINNIFSEISLPFTHEVLFVTIQPTVMKIEQSALHGNIFSLSLICDVFDTVSPKNAWIRLKSIFNHLMGFLSKGLFLMPMIQREISAHFPELPPLRELQQNLSLTFYNTHPSMTKARPMLPSQVEIGGIHCRPARPLPSELESWMAGALDAGVVYFSLGSVTRGSSLPKQYQDIFLEAFRRLPQRVLWKYEGELEGAPDNIRTSAWLPQQDVLGHEQVRVFVTHGGMLGLQEAVYHATPVLVLPIYADQFDNGRHLKNAGLGQELVWEELTVDAVVVAVTEVINNPRYMENMARVSPQMRDQLTTPQERLVFWTEYIIRHRGAAHLRYPGGRQSLLELLLLDVIALVLGAILAFLLLLWGAWKVIGAVTSRRKIKVD